MCIRDSSVREIIDRLGGVRQLVEVVRIRSDSIWERFITLTLERLLSNQLREFLDGVDVQILALSQQMVEADCEIDRLRARVQKRRGWPVSYTHLDVYKRQLMTHSKSAWVRRADKA